MTIGLNHKVRPVLAVAVALAMLAVAACGGGGGSSTIPGYAQKLQLKTPLASPTPNRGPDVASTTMPLGSGPIALPAVGDISGATVTLNVSSPPPGSSLTLTAYDAPPPGAPVEHGMSAPIPVFWVSSTYSSSATANGFPSQLSYTLPYGFNLMNTGFDVETFDGTAGTYFGYDIGSLSGDRVAVGDSSTRFVVPGHTYWWELACFGTNPLNVPLSTAGQTTKMLPMCGFDDTSVTTPPNDAAPGAYLEFDLTAPPCCNGPSPPPGTTTGLMALRMVNSRTSVPQGADYQAGALQFEAVVPSVISTQGKTFVAAGCTVDIVWVGGSNYKTPCVDTPYISGPLAVSGQTISFAGLPFPISLPAMSGSDCAGLTDCTWPAYTVNVYY